MAEAPEPARAEASIGNRFGRTLLAVRWVVAPFYLGLLCALLLLVVKFVQKLVAAVPVLLTQSSSDTIFTVLSLIDLSLVANLLVIVMFSGWQNFIGRLPAELSGDVPDWLGRLDFSAVKLKLIGAVMVIGTISILESFVYIDQTPKADVAWQVAILLAVGVTGVLLALMDWLGGRE